MTQINPGKNRQQDVGSHQPFWNVWLAGLRKDSPVATSQDVTLLSEQASHRRIMTALDFLHVPVLIAWIEQHDQEATLPFLVAKIKSDNGRGDSDLVLRAWSEVHTIMQQMPKGGYQWLTSKRLPKAQPSSDQDTTLVGGEKSTSDYVFLETAGRYKVYFKKNPWSSAEEWYVLIEILEPYRLQRRDTIEMHLYNIAEEYLGQQCSAARKHCPVDFDDTGPEGFRGRAYALARELQVNEREFMDQLDRATQKYFPKVVREWLSKQGPVEYDPEKIIVDPRSKTTWLLQYDDEGRFSHYKITMWAAGK